MRRFILFLGITSSIIHSQSLVYDAKHEKTSFTWANSNENYGTIEFNIPDVISYGEANSQFLKSNGATYLLQKGYPELLKFTTSIQIPNDKLVELKINESDFIEIENINLAPSKGNIYRNQDPNSIPVEFASVYNQDIFWPEQITTLSSAYIAGKSRGQSLQICPFQYNAVTKVLRIYYHITLSIKISSQSGENVLAENIVQERNAMFINTVQSKYTPVNDQGRILILTPPAFLSTISPYIQWKIQRGIPTDVFTTDVCGTTSTAIKTFISTYYSSHSDLKYILLVGDHAQIPTELDLATNQLGGPSDNFYGYLAGNDHYPDVFVGRFSGENVNQIQTQVRRTIEYEKTPLVQNSFEKGICIASAEGPGDDGEMDFEHSRNMHDDLLGIGYTRVDEFYDGSQGGDDAPGDPNNMDVVESMNDGRGVFLYTGHGSSTSCATSGFSSSDVYSLTNVGKLPFFWNVACVNGEFMFGTCFAESLLRQQNASGNPVGAVATLMSTINQSWSPPMEGQDEMIDLLTQVSDVSSRYTFGALSMNGCMKMNDTYGTAGEEMTDTWTCFGDPNLHVRTKTPISLTATHTFYQSPSNLTFNVQSQENAFVAITRVSGSSIELLGTATVGASGVVNIISSETLNANDSILVTVTKFNHVPYVGTIVMTNNAGIENIQSTVLVYPNPSSDVIYFDFKNTLNTTPTIKIMDVNGRVISTQVITNNVISISSLANGMYFYEIQFGSEKSIGNFVKN